MCSGLKTIMENIQLQSIPSNARIIDYCICLRYTYVLISIDGKKYLGLSHTFINHLSRRKPGINSIEELRLPDTLLSRDPYARQLGFALLNAYSQYLISRDGHVDLGRDVDAVDAVEIGRNERVLFIGDIRPLVERVRERAGEVVVLENDVCRRPDTLPGTYLSLLGDFDVVFITGAALVNGSLDQILMLTRSARERVLVGPTAQIYPGFLRGTGLTKVAGCYVLDPGAVIRGLKIGYGTRWVLRYSRKYVLDVPS